MYRLTRADKKYLRKVRKMLVEHSESFVCIALERIHTKKTQPLQDAIQVFMEGFGHYSTFIVAKHPEYEGMSFKYACEGRDFNREMRLKWIDRMLKKGRV